MKLDRFQGYDDQITARQREKNRAAGIPDMEIGDRHEPAEWFAQAGFFWLLEKIGRSQPDHDWSADGGDDSDREKFLAARRLDHQRIADWLREADTSDLQNRDGAMFGDVRLAWVDRVPSLKTWAGQQTLAKLIRTRQEALASLGAIQDVLACEAAIKGSSGLYKPCATTSLEDGFSINALGMYRVTRVGMELLAMLGAETVPLTVYPDGRTIGYTIGDCGDVSRWKFRVEDRGQYLGRWGTSERAT